VAPRDSIYSLRWHFMPVESPRDRSVQWKWRAYTQSGNVALQSSVTFETLTECMDDAKRHGYGES
jgi:hypothetical protein